MAIAKKYKKYAEDVLSEKIVAGEYIKLACKRYLSFFDRDDMFFDTKAVDKVVNFISKLKHFTGAHNNKPFILSDWQYWIICSIFGFKWKDKKTRVTRTAFVEVARKNGKSSLETGALKHGHGWERFFPMLSSLYRLSKYAGELSL